MVSIRQNSILFLCALLLSLPLFAQSSDEITAVPNRPTFSTTAEAVQRGVFEIEAGWEAGDGLQDINVLLKFGALKRLELRLANDPIIRQDGVTSYGDLGAGFKLQAFQESHYKPTLSFLYTATFPTAGSKLGIGAMGHALLVLASKDFGQHHFDVNEGVQFVGRSGPGQSGFDRNYFSALAYSHPVTKRWGITGEVAGYSHLNAANPASMTLLGAATYNVSSRLVLDGGAYFGVFGNLPRVTFFSGITYSVADLYRRRHRGAKSKP